MSDSRPPTRVLVVEDERLIARAIEKGLTGLGYAVAGSAASGAEGVRLAGERRPDLVLMDITLGSGMDGVEAADQIRARYDLPVVFLTAHSDPATLARAKATGPFGYVLKPFEDRDLQTAVEIGLERHRMDRRLRENERWLAATLGSIGDAVVATDEVGRVRFMNAVAERLTGWPQAAAVGREVREVFNVVNERTRAAVPNPALEALARGTLAELPEGTVLVARDGTERPIADGAAPIVGAPGGTTSGAVLVFRDVTERRRFEEQLRQAAKMEAVGRLAGGIAHDFNNILTAITGYTELLLLAGPSAPGMPAEECRAALQTVYDAGQRAAALTKQILAFSRRQVLVPCVLCPNVVVRDMAAVVRRLLGAQITLDTSLAPDLGHARVDPGQLGQVVLNLAVNARDAMPAGGRLTITTANVELDGPAARALGAAPGAYVSLAVRDTGTGIPADVLPHIFEPFFTTKGVGEGTGLGLATVHGIVTQSGGRVAVESATGAGTEFRVLLPRVSAPDAPPELAPSAGAGVPEELRGTETVLLVEDEDAVRQVTRLVLERFGYTVLEAADGRAGLALAQAHPGPIHLLLTDIIMPLMNGRELADAVTAHRPDTRVLFVSGYTDDPLVHDGVASAGKDFLHKPFTSSALGTKIRELLARTPS